MCFFAPTISTSSCICVRISAIVSDVKVDVGRVNV